MLTLIRSQVSVGGRIGEKGELEVQGAHAGLVRAPVPACLPSACPALHSAARPARDLWSP
jgi:hypothetical protein